MAILQHVKTTSDKWTDANKQKYKDALTLITDTGQIYNDGIYYGAGNCNIKATNGLLGGDC